MPTPGQTDKDILFQKILPAISQNPFSDTSEQELSGAPLLPPEDEDDRLTHLRNRLFGRSEQNEVSTYVTLNIMELLVYEHLDEVMSKFNTCQCDRCRCDVAALALTNLPAKYVVTHPQYRSRAQQSIDLKSVVDAMVKAVIQVRGNLRH